MNTIYKEILKVFERVKNEPRNNQKIKYLKEFPHKAELKRFMCLAYDPRVVFGITSKAFKPKRGGLVAEIDPGILEAVLEARGRNEKIRVFESKTSWLSPAARSYLLAALDKDLKIGIGIKTINKALDNPIDEFKVMLAHKQTSEKYQKNFSDTIVKLYNIKVDGIRCIIDVKSKNDICFYSRDGREMEEFLVENIRYEISKCAHIFIGRKLDGEIYSDHFQKLMRIYRRKNVDMNSIYIRNSTRYAIFDLIDMADKPLMERVREMNLTRSILPDNLRFIKFLEYYKFEGTYEELGALARKFIKSGEEGIIIKHPQAKYEFKRSNYWLKFKNKETVDLSIVGYYCGEPGTEFENALGGIVIKYNNEEVRCGSGFSKDERFELWKNPDELIGLVAELSFMEETKAGSLRHPVFEKLRFDKE